MLEDEIITELLVKKEMKLKNLENTQLIHIVKNTEPV